jgi:hypothetical protein
VAVGLAAAAAGNEALDLLEARKDMAASGAAAPAAAAVEPLPAATGWPPSPLDPWWARSVLFEDESNPWLQRMELQGLLEGGGAWGTAEHDIPATGLRQDTQVDSMRLRRARLGARLRMFRNTDIDARFELDDEHAGIDELKARVELRPWLNLSFGKMRPQFSAEYSASPRSLLTPERSLLVNQFAPASTPGVMLGGDTGRWDYGLGWFSGDSGDGFVGWEGSGFLLAKLGYESVSQPDGQPPLRSRWYLDYLRNFDGAGSDSVPRYRIPPGTLSVNGGLPVAQPWYRDLVATGVELEQGRFGFLGEFLLGRGESNAWGLTLMPSFWAIPGKLKLVARYHYADSDEVGGIITGLGTGVDPWFDSSPLYAGDEFHSFYLGANWHLYQDRVVLLNGVEFSILNDDEGAGADAEFWLWRTGARISF